MRLSRALLLTFTSALLFAPMAAAHGDGIDVHVSWLGGQAVEGETATLVIDVTMPPAAFGSDLFEKNKTYAFTFAEEGVFGYHCHPHPWMRGNITVLAADHHAEPKTHHVRVLDGATNADYRYEPENLTISVGDTVHWMNEGSMAHTVSPNSGMGHEAHGDDSMNKEMANGSSMSHDTMHHPAGANKSMAHDDMHHEEGMKHDTLPMLTVTVSYQDQKLKLALEPLAGTPGRHVARFVPGAAGTFGISVTGMIDEQKIEAFESLRVAARGDTFPAVADDAATAALNARIDAMSEALEVQAGEIATLKAKAKTAANTVAPVDEQNATPGLAMPVLLSVVVLGAVVLRRRK